jgi:uncharacterized membrane protein SpoIIM required for sporulation
MLTQITGEVSEYWIAFFIFLGLVFIVLFSALVYYAILIVKRYLANKLINYLYGKKERENGKDSEDGRRRS